MNIYKTMKDHHQNEINNFPMFFAFNQEQFNEGMESLGLNPNETNKISSIGAGGYIRKTDSEKLRNIGKNQQALYNRWALSSFRGKVN